MDGASKRIEGMGSLIKVLETGEFKIRIPRKKVRFAQGFIGGLCMGFG